MEASHHIPMALRAAYLSMHRQTNAQLNSLGVTADQFVCLLLLSEHEGIIQSELVALAHSDPNTISAIVAKLEKKQLVRREAHAEDRRARTVWLTKSGRLAVTDAVQSLEAVNQKVNSVLSKSDAEHLVLLLNRVSGALG